MQQSVHTPQELSGMDHLIELLIRVRAKGWSDAFASETAEVISGLNSNESGRSSEGDFPYSEPLLSLREAMAEARICLAALDNTRERLKKRLRALRKVSMPLVLEDGIKRLPDDVLADIFDIGHRVKIPAAGVARFSPIRTSHVSRRFRRISLQIPSLWTTILERYGESQIREYVARSGQLDLDIKMEGSISGSEIESFLKILKGTAHRWSSFDLTEDDTQLYMTGLGITHLPRLRHLTFTYPAELPSAFSLPKLSQVVGWGLIPAENWFLTQLTHFELNLSEEDEDIGELAVALCGMKNLQDLSFNLLFCTIADGTFLPITYREPRSVQIDRLAISIRGEMQDYSATLFKALMYLRPSTVELEIYSMWPEKFLFNSDGKFFPYGSAINIQIPQTIDIMTTLANLLRSCDIVKTVYFDTPMATNPFGWHERRLDERDWARIRSLDHLRFMNCDRFSESDVEALTRKFLRTETEQGLQSLEIISCKMISEDFLLGLRDEVGNRLKWTL